MTQPTERNNLIEVFLAKNKQLNLSAIRSPDEVYEKHILDALSLLQFMTFPDWAEVIDIGTGGWFPLLPLATSFPNTSFTWLDARRKKTEAIQDMAKTLWLQNITTVWSRVEEHKHSYDFVTARAVAYADKLFHRSHHVCKRWWTVIRYKLRTAEENADIRELCTTHKWDCDVHTYALPSSPEKQRALYILRKP